MHRSKNAPRDARELVGKGDGEHVVMQPLLGGLTVGLYNFAVARSSLPDDLVYAIAEAVFSGNDELMQASHAAAETVPANFTRNTLLPFHPGAMRWYANKATAGVLYGD